jgi:hypothetical protein
VNLIFQTNFPAGKYSELRHDRIISTLEALQQRIGERFPGSGLSQVAAELRSVATAIVKLSEQLRRPLWVVRLVTIAAITSLIGFSIWLAILTFHLVPARESGLMDLLQGIESAINELIFLSLTILFFATLENRLKRRAALGSLHRLRSLAHVVDMHQLTKDPAYLLTEHLPTAASPERLLTAYELTRYLDYCSELLAIISKLAALHVQNLQDSQVMDTVNDVENLSQGLAGKIWQKIMILDMASPAATSDAASTKSSAGATKSAHPK